MLAYIPTQAGARSGIVLFLRLSYIAHIGQGYNFGNSASSSKRPKKKMLSFEQESWLKELQDVFNELKTITNP